MDIKRVEKKLSKMDIKRVQKKLSKKYDDVQIVKAYYLYNNDTKFNCYEFIANGNGNYIYLEMSKDKRYSFII